MLRGTKLDLRFNSELCPLLQRCLLDRKQSKSAKLNEFFLNPGRVQLVDIDTILRHRHVFVQLFTISDTFTPFENQNTRITYCSGYESFSRKRSITTNIFQFLLTYLTLTIYGMSIPCKHVYNCSILCQCIYGWDIVRRKLKQVCCDRSSPKKDAKPEEYDLMLSKCFDYCITVNDIVNNCISTCLYRNIVSICTN